MFKFNLGDICRDTYTGFTGHVHANAEYITGCNRVGLNTRKITDAGKEPESEWFDEMRLELCSGVAVVQPKNENGGPSTNPTQRRGI